MKIKSKQATKVKPPSNLADQIDEACGAYDSASRTEKEASAKKAQANDKIKNTALMFGVKRGKETIVTGHKWEGGFNEVEQPYLDPQAALKVLAQGVYLQVKERVTVINPDKFKQLVDDGTITQDEARKIIKYKDPQRRIIVRPRKGSPTP